MKQNTLATRRKKEEICLRLEETIVHVNETYEKVCDFSSSNFTYRDRYVNLHSCMYLLTAYKFHLILYRIS